MPLFWILLSFIAFIGILGIGAIAHSIPIVVIVGIGIGYLFLFIFFKLDPKITASKYFGTHLKNKYSTFNWKSIQIKGEKANLTAELFQWNNQKNTNVQVAIWNLKLAKNKEGWIVKQSVIT